MSGLYVATNCLIFVNVLRLPMLTPYSGTFQVRDQPTTDTQIQYFIIYKNLRCLNTHPCIAHWLLCATLLDVCVCLQISWTIRLWLGSLQQHAVTTADSHHAGYQVGEMHHAAPWSLLSPLCDTRCRVCSIVLQTLWPYCSTADIRRSQEVQTTLNTRAEI